MKTTTTKSSLRRQKATTTNTNNGNDVAPTRPSILLIPQPRSAEASDEDSASASLGGMLSESFSLRPPFCGHTSREETKLLASVQQKNKPMTMFCAVEGGIHHNDVVAFSSPTTCHCNPNNNNNNVHNNDNNTIKNTTKCDTTTDITHPPVQRT